MMEKKELTKEIKFQPATEKISVILLFQLEFSQVFPVFSGHST